MTIETYYFIQWCSSNSYSGDGSLNDYLKYYEAHKEYLGENWHNRATADYNAAYNPLYSLANLWVQHYNPNLVALNTQQLIDNGMLTLDGYKQEKINHLSNLSFSLRQAFLPDYKLINAAIGIYGDETKTQYLNCVTAFRTEFYRLKALIELATTVNEIDTIVASANYPTSL